MEWTNDSGLRDSDMASDGGGSLGLPQTHGYASLAEEETSRSMHQGVEGDSRSSQVRCRCVEQQGSCIYCRLGQLRAEENGRATAQAPLDPRVAYAEAAARQLEARIAELGGRGNGEDRTAFEPEHPSSIVGSPTTCSRNAKHVVDGDAPLPDWLVKMIQNPTGDWSSRSVSRYQHRTDSPQHRQRSMVQRRQGGSQIEVLEDSVSRERKVAPDGAKSRPSTAYRYDASPDTQLRSPSQSRPSSTDLGNMRLVGTQAPNSPVRHPRPWSPPSADRSLHCAGESIDTAGQIGQDRERRRQAARLAKEQTTKQHANSKADTKRSSSATRHRRRGTGGTDATSSELVLQEVERLRKENHVLRSGEELLRLRNETQSLRTELTEQKQVFRLQLSRMREEKRVLQEQIVALHAEKRAGSWTAGAGAAVGAHAGEQRQKYMLPPRPSSSARSVEFDLSDKRALPSEGVGKSAELSRNTSSPAPGGDNRSDTATVEEITS